MSEQAECVHIAVHREPSEKHLGSYIVHVVCDDCEKVVSHVEDYALAVDSGQRDRRLKTIWDRLGFVELD